MQAVSTPAAPPHVALAKQLEHGAYPVADHDVPASHSALHTVFVVAVQSISTFFAPPHASTHRLRHVALHQLLAGESMHFPIAGCTPSCATHSPSSFWLHCVASHLSTPSAEVYPAQKSCVAAAVTAAQIEHGAYPVADHDVPATHSALHTVFVVAVQAVSTFFAPPHVVTAAQLVHGTYPVADHDVPATHGGLHTVFVVAVQAV